MKSCIVEDNKPNISQRDFADITDPIKKGFFLLFTHHKKGGI